MKNDSLPYISDRWQPSSYPDKETGGWLESVEENLARLSGEVMPREQYSLLKAALDELERRGRSVRLPRKRARKYIECSFDAFKHVQIAFAYYALLSVVLENARRYAVALGDRRSTAILDLQLAKVLLPLNRLKESEEACSRGLAAIDVLGDKTFTEFAGRFLILYHHLQGEPAKVLDTYRDIRSSLDADSDPFVIHHVLPIVAVNATFVGQFRLGRRLVTNAWRAAQSHGYVNAEKHLEGNLGMLLTAAGDLEQARVHLTAATDRPDESCSPLVRFWAERTRAYLMHAEGDLEGAYEQMKQAKKTADRGGLQASFFVAPWMVQMLRAFYWAGFPAIRGFEYLEKIEAIKKDPSMHTRGVAYRLLALDAGQRKASVQEQLELLRKSEELLLRVSGTIELGKTWLEMARIFLSTGDVNLAGPVISKAWQVFGRSAPGLFPRDLLHFVDQVPETPKDETIWSTYNSLMDMLARLPVPLSQYELGSRMVSIVCSFFGADRAGLFVRDIKTGRIGLESAQNIPGSQNNGTYEAAALDLVNRALQGQEPVLGGPFQDRELSTMLGIPLTIGGGTKVLYLEASDAMDIFDELSSEQILSLSRQVGRLFSMLIDLLGATEEAFRHKLGQATSANPSLDNNLLYRSGAMERTIHLADLAAQSDVSVIILGETGVGKELLARRVHRLSDRSHMPFVTVDLSTLSEALIESELFGHEKGAFTGANEQKAGQIELADKGTLFIDEIGDAPLSVQLKLLRVLQEKTYRRVGGTKVFHSDFRLIVATNKDLQSMTREGRFREDLYYRLNVISILIPPLRERKEDIGYLSEHFLTHFSRKHGKPAPLLTKDHENSLKAYDWPGNVRELKNLMERVIVLRDDSLLYAGPQTESSDSMPEATLARPTSALTLDNLQIAHIEKVLRSTGGRISGKNGAAEVLGLKRSTLYNRMKKLGIENSPSDDYPGR